MNTPEGFTDTEWQNVLAHPHPGFTDSVWAEMQADIRASARALQKNPRDKSTNESHLRELRGSIGAIRTEMYQGKPHLVFPVVATQEGVIETREGTHPELVTVSSLTKSLHSFNGQPLLVGHPRNSNGSPITANDARIWEQSFGQTFNARMVGSKLVVDAYVDPVKAEQVGGADFVARLRDGTTPIEVSLGAYCTFDPTPGRHNGKAYGSKWTSAVGDHLAFLPHGVGACSVDDGCGTHRSAETQQQQQQPQPQSHRAAEAPILKPASQEVRNEIQRRHDLRPPPDPYAAIRPKDVTMPADYKPFSTPPNPYAKKEQP
jgi:hypothetical protein